MKHYDHIRYNNQKKHCSENPFPLYTKQPAETIVESGIYRYLAPQKMGVFKKKGGRIVPIRSYK